MDARVVALHAHLLGEFIGGASAGVGLLQAAPLFELRPGCRAETRIKASQQVEPPTHVHDAAADDQSWDARKCVNIFTI